MTHLNYEGLFRIPAVRADHHSNAFADFLSFYIFNVGETSQHDSWLSSTRLAEDSSDQLAWNELFQRNSQKHKRFLLSLISIV